MTQILYTANGKTFDIGTQAGKDAAFGKPRGTLISMFDENGELLCVYDNVRDIPRNTEMIKSIRAQYPGVPLLKALGLLENELLLKSKPQPPKAKLLLKARQPSKQPSQQRFEYLLKKLDALQV